MDSLNLSLIYIQDTLSFSGILTYCDSLAEKSFFNFTTFVTAMAFLILAWTNADYKYQFRFKTSLISSVGLFFVVFILGFATVLNDYFRFDFLLSYQSWQLTFAFLLLVSMFFWAFFCFVTPLRFSLFNHKRYREEFQKIIFHRNQRAVDSLLEDLQMSISNIISSTRNHNEIKNKNISQKTRDALKIIHLMGNDFFAKAVVDSGGFFAVELFKNMKEKNRFKIGIHAFAGNFITHALINEESFLFNEIKNTNGAVAYLKPIINSVYSDFELVCAIPELLDYHGLWARQWSAAQVKGYSEILLRSLKSFFKNWDNDFFFIGVFENFTRLAEKIYELNNYTEDLSRCDKWLIYNEVMCFFQELIRHIASIDIPKKKQMKFIENGDLLDIIADSIVNIMGWISIIKGPKRWRIQHSCFWEKIFHTEPNNKSVKVLMFKLRRAIYLRIKENCGCMGIRIHLMMLDIMGLTLQPKKKESNRNEYILHYWVLNYTKYNLWNYYRNNPKCVKDCMPDGLMIDEDRKELYVSFSGKKGLQLM